MSQIRVELQLEDKSFVQGIWRSGQSLKDFREELARTNPHFDKMQAAGRLNLLAFQRQDQSVRSLSQRLRDLSIITGGATLAFRALSGASNNTVGNIIRINAEMEKLKYQLAGMSDAAAPMKEATDQVHNLQEMAATTPFSIGNLSNSFVKLKAAGLDPTRGSLRALTDGLAAFGASDDYLHRVTIALTQMQGKGVLSMEELRQQLGEAMPNAMQIFARSMGVTVGELAKMVSSGMVESSSSIQKFLGELNRSYAGTGEYMMQTFSGLMARIRTELTRQVTNGEMGAAFTDLKQKMAEFAEFLSSDSATEFFDSVGRGLQNVMDLASAMMGPLGNLRDFFSKFGGTIALAFAGVAVTRAIVSFGDHLLKARVALVGMETSAGAAKTAILGMFSSSSAAAATNAIAVSNAAKATAAATAASAAATATTATGLLGRIGAGVGALGRVGTAFGGFVMGASRFLSVLGPIGIGLSVLVPVAWEIGKGIWSWVTGANKAKDALNDTVDVQVRALRISREADREELVRKRQAAQNSYNEFKRRYGEDYAPTEIRFKKLQDAEDAIKQFDEETSSRVGDIVSSHVDQQVDEAKKRITSATREISRDYYKSMVAFDKEYETRLKNAEKNGESVRDIQEWGREERNKRRVDRQKVLIKFYDEEIDRLTQLMELNEADPKAVSSLIEERDRLRDEMKNWKPEDYKIELISGVESEEKKFERLTKNVENARERLKGLQAELNGASGAVAKLMYQIERGDFGNFKNATDQAIALRDALVETTIAAETIDGVMKGVDKTISDAKRGYENSLEENLRLRAIIAGVDPTNEYDFYTWKRDNGHLEGIGDAEDIVNQAIKKVTDGIDLSTVMFEALGKTIRNEAFGNKSVSKINETSAALVRVRDVAGEIRDIMLSGNTGSFIPMPGFMSALQGAGYTGSIAGAAPGDTSWLKYSNQGAIRNKPLSADLVEAMSFLKLMGIKMDVFSGGQDETGPNRTGSHRHDNGNAADVRFYKDGRLLNWSNPEDVPVFQEIVRKAYANGVTGFGAGPGYMSSSSMHIGYGSAGVWGKNGEGKNAANWLKNIFDVISKDTFNGIVSGLKSRQSEEEGIHKKWKTVNEANRALKPEAAYKQSMDRLKAVREAQKDGSKTDDETMGTYERRAREEIAQELYKGVSSEDLEKMIDTAKEADKHLADIKANKKDINTLDQNTKKLEAERLVIEQRRQDALAKAKNPNFKNQSGDLNRLLKLEKEQLDVAERLYGKNSPQYKAEKERIQGQRQAIMGADSAEAYAELSKAAFDADRDAIEKARDLRKREFEDKLAELATLRERAIADGSLVAEANKAYEKAVAAVREKYRRDNRTELQAQLDEMSKYAEKMNKSTATWASGLSDAIYGAITNQDDAWKILGNSIRESLARSLTDAAAAAIMKPFEKLIAGDGSDNSGIGGLFQRLIGKLTGGDAIKSITSAVGSMMNSLFGGTSAFMSKGKGASVGVKHTGGIVGQISGSHRNASIANFIGAPKFHTGGIIGQSKFRTGLAPSEIPIIAKKGEGVFTKEQMKHLGSSVNSQNISINAPVTVNASGGTPEQNADLANKMAAQTEKMLRNVVQQEMLKQKRPGGILR